MVSEKLKIVSCQEEAYKYKHQGEYAVYNSNFYVGMARLETLPKGNELLYRRPLMCVIFYPDDLPDKYKPKASDYEPSGKLKKEYVENLVREYAEIGGITDGWVAYAMHHYGECVTQYDLDKEKSRIYDVYMAFRNNDENLRTYISNSNKPWLALDEARNDALNLPFEEFYIEYAYYTEESIGQGKKPHIHVVFYYPNASNKFNIYSVIKNIKTEFYNSRLDRLNGMLLPIALCGSINEMVRYETHVDIEGKKTFDFRDIVAINCDDAAERYTDGAPSKKMSDLSRKFYRIAVDNGCYTYNSLLAVLKFSNSPLYEIAGTRTGRQLAEGAAKDAYKKKKSIVDWNKEEELRRFRLDDLKAKENMSKSLGEIAEILRKKNK